MFLRNEDANEAKEDKDHQDGQKSSWIIINRSKFPKNKTVDLNSGTLKAVEYEDDNQAILSAFEVVL